LGKLILSRPHTDTQALRSSPWTIPPPDLLIRIDSTRRSRVLTHAAVPTSAKIRACAIIHIPCKSIVPNELNPKSKTLNPKPCRSVVPNERSLSLALSLSFSCARTREHGPRACVRALSLTHTVCVWSCTCRSFCTLVRGRLAGACVCAWAHLLFKRPSYAHHFICLQCMTHTNTHTHKHSHKQSNIQTHRHTASATAKSADMTAGTP